MTNPGNSQRERARSNETSKTWSGVSHRPSAGGDYLSPITHTTHTGNSYYQRTQGNNGGEE